MYEDRYRRNLSSVENPTLEANVTVSISRNYVILVWYMEICLFLNRCPCNRKKSNLKQDPKSTQPQNKFRCECHLFQNNIAVSQIKLIQQNKWRNTCKHHVARWQRCLANEVASRIELHASQITHPCLTPPLGGIPFEFLAKTYPAKTRGMGLLYGENRMILASTVFDWSTHVMDRQTDWRTDGRMGGR